MVRLAYGFNLYFQARKKKYLHISLVFFLKPSQYLPGLIKGNGGKTPIWGALKNNKRLIINRYGLPNGVHFGSGGVMDLYKKIHHFEEGTFIRFSFSF